MNEQDQVKYPFEECYHCIHKNVCKHIDTLVAVIDSGLLPIDFSTATCVEYYEDIDVECPFDDGTCDGLCEDCSHTKEIDSMLEALDKDADGMALKPNPIDNSNTQGFVKPNDKSLLGRINSVYQSLMAKGLPPVQVQMSKATMDDLSKSVYGYKIKEDLTHIQTSDGSHTIPVIRDDTIPYGQFVFISDMA